MIATECAACRAPLQFGWSDAGAVGPCYRCGAQVQVPLLPVTCAGCGTVSGFQGSQIGASGPCRCCGQTMTVAPPGAPGGAPTMGAMGAPGGGPMGAPGGRPPMAATPAGPQAVPPIPVQQKALLAIGKQAGKAGLTMGPHRVLMVGAGVSTQERLGQALSARFNPFGGKVRVDRVLQVRLEGSPITPFVLSVPYSGNRALAHELASLLPGTLPSSLSLVRGAMGSWSSGRFEGPEGPEDPVAEAASDEFEIGDGVEWNWEEGKTIIKLEWGLQAVPTPEGQTLHVMQTAKHGILSRGFGLDWYVERQRAFRDFLGRYDGTAAGAPYWWMEPVSLLATDWL